MKRSYPHILGRGALQEENQAVLTEDTQYDYTLKRTTIFKCRIQLQQQKQPCKDLLRSAQNNSKDSKPKYHTLRSPRSRCPHSESGPQHGCLHTKPVGRGAPQKTPRALAPKSPCRAHPPLRWSHNSPTQTCTSGPHLQKQQQQQQRVQKSADTEEGSFLKLLEAFPHSPVMQAVKSAPHATCRMAFPCSFSTLFGCRYEAWSPCPSWPTILAPPWTFLKKGVGKVPCSETKTTGFHISRPDRRVDTHRPCVQLLFHCHHCKVTLACTHVLGAAASFKSVYLLGGELPSPPEVHLS